MANETLRVRGYREFLAAVAHADAKTKRVVRDTLRQVGDLVRVDAERLFSKYDERSAAGFRVRVRQRGVIVEQSFRKTTGTRPDYGALQMKRGLLDALRGKQAAVEAATERALDVIANTLDRT